MHKLWLKSFGMKWRVLHKAILPQENTCAKKCEDLKQKNTRTQL